MKNQSFYRDIISQILHEETGDVPENPSSSVSDERIFFIENSKEDVSEACNKTATSSYDKNVFGLSEIDRLVVQRNVKYEKERKDILVARLVSQLEKALDLYDSEEGGGLSSAEKKIIEIEKKYKMRILGEVIQNIYVHHFHNASYLTGICNSLIRYDLNEVQPWGATMLTGFLNHPDERVQEATVQLIDNWSDVELLPILKTLMVSSNWMRDYVSNVVKCLEKENVLYQKAI